MKATINLTYEVPYDKLEEFGALIKQLNSIAGKTPPPSEKKPKAKRKRRKAYKRRVSKTRKAAEKYAVDYFKKHGYYPTYEEAAKHFGVNYKCIHERLKRYRVRIRKNQKPQLQQAA